MYFWGKIIGTVSGLVTGRPWFILLGLLLGHQFDRGFAERFAQARAGRDSLLHLPEYFIKALFQIMGYVAKSDGRVSEDEIRAVRALMHRLGMRAPQIRRAIAWFDSGKDKAFPLLETVRKLKQESSREPKCAGSCFVS